MELKVVTKGRVPVGSSSLSRPVPRAARIVVSDQDPYNLDIRLVWDDDEQRLVADEVRITRCAGGAGVRMSDLAKIKLGELIETALEGEVLDDRGWTGVVEDHPDDDPVAVDALIYALAHALGGQRPTQTVAVARGLQPGSAIKRVMRAREMGYLGEAMKGRSGGLANNTTE